MNNIDLQLQLREYSNKIETLQFMIQKNNEKFISEIIEADEKDYKKISKAFKQRQEALKVELREAKRNYSNIEIRLLNL